MTAKYAQYLRVSTGRQGRSGLGLEAQEQTIRDRLQGGHGVVVATFSEIETGTNKRVRPELAKALAHCRVTGSKLIVANVSRLTRDPDFMGTLVAADVEVEFCDLPNTTGPVGKFMLRQMLSVAELEAGMVSERTRKALKIAREVRGIKLGSHGRNLVIDSVAGRAASLKVRQDRAARRIADISPIISEIRAAGASSLAEIAVALNLKGIPAARGGSWGPAQVRRMMPQTT